MTNVPKDSLHPGNNLVAGWIRRFIKVNHTGAYVGFEVAFERGAAAWDGSKMASSNENCRRRIVSFEDDEVVLHILRGEGCVRQEKAVRLS